jgi:hypothetical protein
MVLRGAEDRARLAAVHGVSRRMEQMVETAEEAVVEVRLVGSQETWSGGRESLIVGRGRGPRGGSWSGCRVGRGGVGAGVGVGAAAHG